MGILENAKNATENYNQRRMAVSSTTGQQGQANTLSGAANTDLSGQFYDEQQDLWMGREQAINATKTQQAQDTVNAIGNGISTGMDVYNAGKAFGAGKSSAAAAPGSSPVTIRGAFNIDPSTRSGSTSNRYRVSTSTWQDKRNEDDNSLCVSAGHTDNSSSSAGEYSLPALWRGSQGARRRRDDRARESDGTKAVQARTDRA
jgi:hypothetical protein